MRPDITVLMSVYNGERFIEGSIKSVLEQNFDRFELLVVDDRSTDRTPQLVSKFNDPRIRMFRNDKNLGLYVNLNILLHKARAPLIKLWSQDDIMLRNCLQRGQNFYLEHRDVGYFYTSCDWISEQDEILEPDQDSTPIILEPSLADYYCFLHGNLSANISNLFIPKRTFELIGVFNEDYISADFDFAVRAQRHCSIGRIPEVLIRLRQHKAQWSQSEGSIIYFLSEDIKTYEILRNRLVHEQGTLTNEEARIVLTQKFAKLYFHAAVRHYMRGNIAYGNDIIRQLRAYLPINSLATEWLLSLPLRFLKKK